MSDHHDLDNHIQAIRQEAGDDAKIVFVSGNFNIVHPGHLRLLRFAADCGTYLVVGVYANTLDRGASLEENLRLEGVGANSAVNYAFIIRHQPEVVIQQLKPHVVVKGKEHEDCFNTEAEAVLNYGGKLLFSSGDAAFSSIDLLRQEFERINTSSIFPTADYPARHQFSFSDLAACVKQFQDRNILVVGDTIVDEYIDCEALGMSQEDPTIVVSPVHTKTFVGAAAIVAAHARGLGAKVNFVSVGGADESRAYIEQQMKKFDVNYHYAIDESRPTTRKQRFRANGKTLLRVNHLKQHEITKSIQDNIFEAIADRLEHADALVFSDFNYGCLPQELVEKISQVAKQKGVMCVADSQSSSQIGDVSRFTNMKLLTPTEREARLAVQDYSSGLVVLAEKLRQKANAEHIFLTLGKEGMIVHASHDDPGTTHLDDRLPAMNHAPKDVSGAGDSMLITATLALSSGANIWSAAYLGALAAACQVSRTGNTPLLVSDILDELK